jgi:tripartite-type tricarboxylate transporter receptor subunit TctC
MSGPEKRSEGITTMMMRRMVLSLGLAVLTSTAAFAQAYPSRPVKIIVPFGPGGPADIYARAAGQHLS